MAKGMLGVIGGLGPMATVRFMEMIISMTQGYCDQQHIPMMVVHNPQIPDRTSYILDKGCPSPVNAILEAARILQENGAAEIAIPCITAHFFYEELQKGVSIPLIDGVDETMRYLTEHHYEKVGIMATEGTVRTGLFTKALKKNGMEAVYPDEQHQKYISELIFKYIKAGKEPDLERLFAVQRHLIIRRAQVIVLGCTELSLIEKRLLQRGLYVDALEVLARYCVNRFGILKEAYQR